MTDFTSEEQLAINRLLTLPESEIGRDLVDFIITRMQPKLKSPNVAGLATIALARAYEVRWGMDWDDADVDSALAAYGRLVEDPLAATMAQSTIGKILGIRYERTNDRVFLDQAIESVEHALEGTREGTPPYTGRTLNLVRFMIQGASNHNSRELSERAISRLWHALQVTPEADSNRAALQIQLGDAILRSMEAGWGGDDGEALDLIQGGMAQIPGGPQHDWAVQRVAGAGLLRAIRLRSLRDLRRALPFLEALTRRDPDPWSRINLAAALSLRAELGHDTGDLTRAEAVLAAVIEETADGSAERVGALLNHADVLRQLAEGSDDLAGLERAAGELREVISWASATNENETLISALANLGVVLIGQGRQSDDVSNLNAAVQYFKSARQHEPNPPQEAQIAARLGSALLIKYQRTRDHGDLAAAVAELEAAWAAFPDEAPRPMQLQSDLAAAHAFAAVGGGPAEAVLDQLNDAISLMRELVTAAGVQGPNSRAAIQSLATVLLLKYEATSDAGLLDEANRLLDGRLQRADVGRPPSAAESLVLGSRLLEQYRTAGLVGALDRSIEVLRDGAALPGEPEVSAVLSMELGIALRHRFLRDGDPADLDAAVEAGRRAVDSYTAPGKDLAAALANLANAQRVRFEHGGNPTDLDAAVAGSRRALTMLPANDGSRASVLTALGNALQMRAALRGSISDATEVVEIQRAAVQACEADDPRLPRNLMNLAGALAERFRLVGAAEDLDQAVECTQQAVEHPAVLEGDLAVAGTNLAIMLRDRWETRHDPVDLELSVEAASRALGAAPNGHPVQLRALGVLADMHRSRFTEGGDQTDLDRAIDLRRRALSATRSGHPDYPRLAVDLGSDLVTRSEAEGSLNELASGLELLKEVERLLSEDHDDRSAVLLNLAVALRARYKATGDVTALDEAVRRNEEAIHARNAPVADQAMASANLSACLLDRYLVSDEVADLEQAVTRAQAVDDLAPGSRPVRATATVNLSLALRELFERRGQAADLDASIAAASRSLELATSDSSRVAAWSALGSAWQARYEWDGQLDDLRHAIQAHRQARETASAHGPFAATLLHNLGNVLRAWYEVSGDNGALDESITETRAAVAATPAASAERLGSLTNLGNALRQRYAVFQRTDDLRDAIEAQREAVTAAGEDYPGRRSLLTNLANSLQARSKVTGDPADLRMAVTQWRRASAVPPTDHPDRCVILLALAHGLRDLATSDGVALAHEARGLLQEAVGLTTAPPQERIAAARAWGEAAHEQGDREDAVQGFVTAVNLLPQVAWHGLDQDTRERQLARLSGLAADAAAAAILAGQPERAIELLEQGRSVLWSQALDLRSDLSALAEAAPDLERRLREVSVELGSGSKVGRKSSVSDRQLVSWESDGSAALARAAELRQVRSRRELALEWDALVAQVREIPGFGAFLKPVPYRELREAVLGGPLAVVNVSRLGCHALVLVPLTAEVSVVNLPGVSLASVTEQVEGIRRARSGRADANRAVTDVLSWTWEHIAEPVLDSSTVREAFESATGPRRIWWCSTGPAAMLPLHAATAGRAPENGGASAPDSVMARAISSYTPTLAALRRSRTASGRLADPDTSKRRQLAIGMPDTPGSPLPFVLDEMAELQRYFPPPTNGLQLVGKDKAVRARVLEELPGRSWVHWACHGGQNETDPRQSAFMLGDGPLTIEDLVNLSLVEPEFAYLSACETATGSTLLVDEALHLAAATQLVGYSHVIATLWTIGDDSAAQVTKAVYRRLNSHGAPEVGDAAAALHAAVTERRRQHPDAPLAWAPFIHLGP